MADGTNGAGAGYGFGSDRFFGTAGLGFNRFTGADQTQFAMATLFGAQFRASSDAALAVCPVGQVRHGVWPQRRSGLAAHSCCCRWRTDRLRHG